MAMTYEQKLELYREEYEVWGFKEFATEVKLISLVCALTKAARNSTPDVRPFDILVKLKPNIKGYAGLYQALSYKCEGLIKFGAVTSNYGYTKASEIVEEIKRILEDWVPF